VIGVTPPPSIYIQGVGAGIALAIREQLPAILFTMGEKPGDEWCAGYMHGRRAKIEQDQPFINFKWESLGKYL